MRARSLFLYQNILGFQLDYLSEASPTSYLYPVFRLPTYAQLRFASLSTEYEPRALALTEVKGIELPPSSVPHRAAMAIRVRSVEKTIQQVRELGLEAIEPSSFTVPPDRLFTEQAFCDWDGHLIVLYDIKSVEC